MQSKTGKKAALADLDKSVRIEIGHLARKRSPCQLQQPDLSTIVRWKLMRGKFRPRLQQFADAVKSSTLQAASSAMLSLVSEHGLEEVAKYGCKDVDIPLVKAAVCACLAPLTEIKGVGPATASAVLMAATDGIPFMEDAVLELLGPRVYTPACYTTLVIASSRKAAILNTACSSAKRGRYASACEAPQLAATTALAVAAAAGEVDDAEAVGVGSDAASGTKDRKWTARDVCDAIWAVAKLPETTTAIKAMGDGEETDAKATSTGIVSKRRREPSAAEH